MLAVIGDLVQDIIVWQDEPLRPATDTRCRIFCRRGGSAANVAAFAAPVLPTRFIGCVGTGAAGDEVTAELAAAGVDVRVQRRGATGRIVVLVDPAGERHMFPDRGAAAQLRAIDPAWLAGVTLLHLPAYGFQDAGPRAAVIAASEVVRARGGRIMVDASSAGLIRAFGADAFLDLLQALEPQFLSANADEARLLGLTDGAGRVGPVRGRLPHATLVARHGAAPTVVFPPDSAPFEVPVPPVAAVRDATGAGDAFNAGFLGVVAQQPEALRAACVAGHALAARVLRAAGARLDA